MNHIRRLQTDLGAVRAQLSATDEAIREFRIHLAGEKFRGFEADGSRKDWIAVADVHAWLGRIVSAGREP